MSQTCAEQPAITERTKFSWSVVLVLVGVAVTAAAAVAKADAADEAVKTQAAELHRHELRIQRVEDAQATTAEALREIKTSLEKMNSKLDDLATRRR